MAVKPNKKAYWPENEDVRKETRALGLEARLFGPGLEAMGLHPEVYKLEEVRALARGDMLKHVQNNRTQSFEMSFSLGKLKSVYLTQLPREMLAKELKAISKLVEVVVDEKMLRGLKNHEGKSLKCIAQIYPHFTSSKGDPHVDFHVSVYNCGVTEGKNFYSIRNALQEIFQKQSLVKEVVRLEVRHHFEKNLGLKVEKGDLVIVDKAVKDAVLREFSTVKEQVRQKIEDLGRKPTRREYHQFFQEVHASNRHELPRIMGYIDVEKTQAEWKARAEKCGLKSLEQFEKKEPVKEQNKSEVKWEIFHAAKAVFKAIEEKKLSFTRTDVSTQVFREVGKLPDAPTTKQVEQGIDSFMKTAKPLQKEKAKEQEGSFEDKRYGTKETARRDNQVNLAMWKDALKDSVKNIRSFIKEKVEDAKQEAKKEGRAFDKEHFLKRDAATLFKNQAINDMKSRSEQKGKILLTLSADQVPYFLMSYRKTPMGDAHKRAAMEFLRTFSLEAAESKYKRERTPRDRLDSGVIVVVEDPKNKITDVQRDLLRKLSKRDNCKIIVEGPIRPQTEQQEKKPEPEREKAK